MDAIKELLPQSSNQFQEHTLNFVNYYHLNVPFTQTGTHVSLNILLCKKLVLKTFYIIDRVICKILTLELHENFRSLVGNIYQCCGPVLIDKYLDLLNTFNEST